MNEKDTKEKKKFGEVLRDNLQKITIFLVSTIYIAQGLFTITKRDTSIWDILGAISFSIIVGIVISSSLNSLGLKDGRKSQAFINSMKAYGETKEKATPYFDKLASWCNYKNAMELDQRKKEIIQTAGLKWKLYKIGYYTQNKPEREEEAKALELADKCKIERLTSQALLSDLPSEKYAKRRFGQSEQEYTSRGMIFDVISKVFTGIVCGMYSLSPMFTQDNISEKLANVLWNTMQIAMWLAFGMSKYANAKSFIEDEYRQTHLIQKTEYLNEFIVTMQKNPSIIDDFDEDREVQKYIDELINEKKGGIVENEQRKEDVHC